MKSNKMHNIRERVNRRDQDNYGGDDDSQHHEEHQEG